MAKGRQIRSFDYVNHAYADVCEELTGSAKEVFRSATKAAASRAQSVASELRVNIAGIDVGTDIVIEVGAPESKERSGKTPPTTRMKIEWEAAASPRLFPLMKGELAIYPLTSTETQLDFNGEYEVPLGVVGRAIDAIGGHRIADASVHRFVSDVCRYLRSTLGDD